MSKRFAASWLFAIGVVLFLFCVVTAEAKAQTLDRTSFRDLALKLQTPENIANFLWKNFLFENDQRLFGTEEHWQTPEEFLQNKKGDCEDFALFAREMLKANGISSFILNVYGSRFAHTVVVFKDHGKFNVIDGTKVLRLEAESLRDVASEIYPHWKNAAIVAPSPASHTGRIVSQFERDLAAARRLAASA